MAPGDQPPGQLPLEADPAHPSVAAPSQLLPDATPPPIQMKPSCAPSAPQTPCSQEVTPAPLQQVTMFRGPWWQGPF